MADSKTSQTALESYENIIKAYETGGKTGKLEKAFLDIKGVLRTLGYQGDISEISSSEVLLAEFNNIALDNMKKLSGSASDKDVEFVVSGGPSYDKSPEANQILIGQAMHLSKEVINASAFQGKWVDNYLKNNKGRYPKQWELNGAMSAFANRGDTSPEALAKYGTIQESEAFKSVGTKEELVGKIEEKIKTTENPDGTLAPETPEIKANNADLDLKRDTDIGMSDLKKP